MDPYGTQVLTVLHHRAWRSMTASLDLASPERWILRAATAATVDEVFAAGFSL